MLLPCKTRCSAISDWSWDSKKRRTPFRRLGGARQNTAGFATPPHFGTKNELREITPISSKEMAFLCGKHPGVAAADARASAMEAHRCTRGHESSDGCSRRCSCSGKGRDSCRRRRNHVPTLQPPHPVPRQWKVVYYHCNGTLITRLQPPLPV